MKRACCLLAVLILCLVGISIPSCLFAQQTTEEPTLEEVVVTATKTEVPVRELGVSATVITAKEIERRQETDVKELLRDVAGINVFQTGSRGGLTELYHRGGESNFTLVLIDGVQVNEAGGGFDFSTLTTDNIERIEIIRGPQSALYGSDAIGGVIHIITKTGVGKPSAYFSTAHGVHSENGNYMGEQKLGFSAGHEWIGYSLTYGRVDDKGILDVNNEYVNNTYSGRVDIYGHENVDVTFTGRVTDSSFEFPTEFGGDRPDSIFPGLDPDQNQDTLDVTGSGQVRLVLFPWWEHVLHLGIHRLDEEFKDPPNPEQTALDFPPGSFTDSVQTRTTFDYHMNLRYPQDGWLKSTATIGYEYDKESLDLEDQFTSVFGDPTLGFFSTFTSEIDNDRDNHGYYFQEQLTLFDRAYLVGGFRVEDNSVFGTKVNPRGSVAFDIMETGTKFRAAVGTGIKEPTFLESFGGFGTIGNPNLDPEESFSWEIGFDQSLWEGKFQIGATYFENKYDNMIAFIFIPATVTSTFANIQAAESRGVEVSAYVKPGFGLTFAGNYTFLETKVTDDGGIGGLFFAEGEKLLRRPKHSVSFSTDWLWKELNIHLNGTYVGKRDDKLFSVTPDPATGFYDFPFERLENDEYFVLDLAGSYTINVGYNLLKTVKFFAKGKNILDEDYEEVVGFSSPRFSVMGGAALTF